jgi:hypothetical protein
MIYKDDYYLFFIIQMHEIIWKTENNQFDLFKFFYDEVEKDEDGFISYVSKSNIIHYICGRLYILLYSTTRR